MKIGVCAPIEFLPLIEELGYDYIEAQFSWIAGMDEAEFEEKSEWIKKFSIRPEAWNGFFPGSIKLYSLDDKEQEALLSAVAEFAERGFARASAWGGKVAVIGSGRSRGIPDGMTKEQTEERFARVLAVCGEIAQKYGMMVTVEPLSRNECNYLHTVAEGVAVAELSGHVAVGVMVDFYHHHKNQDDEDALPALSAHIYHAHYARPIDRRQPIEENLPHLERIKFLLSQCPHIERISLECAWYPSLEAGMRETRPYVEILKKI